MLFNILILACLAPMVVLHFQNLWGLEQYQFYPILLLAMIWLGWQRKIRVDDLLTMVPRSALPIGMQIFSGLLLLLAVLTGTPNAGYLALLLFLGSLFWEYQKHALIKAMPVLLLGFLLVRLPGLVHNRIITELQLFSSRMSSWLLDTLRVNHLLTGNVVRLPNSELFVDQACSGVVSLVSIMAVGAVYAVYQRYSWIRSVVLIAIGILWTVIMNVLRITTIALADYQYDVDLAHGWQHQTLGLILFAVTLLGFSSTDQILNVISRFIAELEEDDVGYAYSDIQPEPNQPIYRRYSMPWNSWNASLISVLVLSLAAAGLWGKKNYDRVTRTHSDAALVAMAENVSLQTLDSSFAIKDYELVVREPNNPAGAFSNLFILDGSEIGLKDYHFSVDYPYYGDWHELTSCYRGLGWVDRERNVLRVEGEDDFVEVKFTNSGGQEAYLLFSLVEKTAMPIRSPDKNDLIAWMLFNMKQRMMVVTSGELLQYQLWYPSEVDDSQRDTLRQHFLQQRKLAREAIFSSESLN